MGTVRYSSDGLSVATFVGPEALVGVEPFGRRMVEIVSGVNVLQMPLRHWHELVKAVHLCDAYYANLYAMPEADDTTPEPSPPLLACSLCGSISWTSTDGLTAICHQCGKICTLEKQQPQQYDERGHTNVRYGNGNTPFTCR